MVLDDRWCYYYHVESLQALRTARWKLQLPHVDTGAPDPDRIGYGGHRGPVKRLPRKLALYDWNTGPGEQHDIAEQHPEVVQQLLELAERARNDLGDSNTGQRGRGIRPSGRFTGSESARGS